MLWCHPVWLQTLLFDAKLILVLPFYLLISFGNIIALHWNSVGDFLKSCPILNCVYELFKVSSSLRIAFPSRAELEIPKTQEVLTFNFVWVFVLLAGYLIMWSFSVNEALFKVKIPNVFSLVLRETLVNNNRKYLKYPSSREGKTTSKPFRHH